MIKKHFNETKTTQAASLFLKLKGGKMNYMKLIKLLYLAERQALLRWGYPITFDYLVAMPHGPVLSKTLDLINNDKEPNTFSPWHSLIVHAGDYSVELNKEISNNDLDELSDAEIELIKEIFNGYGNIDKWVLIEKLHKELPEWNDPNGSSVKIDYHDILKAEGKTEYEISIIMNEIEHSTQAESIFGE